MKTKIRKSSKLKKQESILKNSNFLNSQNYITSKNKNNKIINYYLLLKYFSIFTNKYIGSIYFTIIFYIFFIVLTNFFNIISISFLILLSIILFIFIFSLFIKNKKKINFFEEKSFFLDYKNFLMYKKNKYFSINIDMVYVFIFLLYLPFLFIDNNSSGLEIIFNFFLGVSLIIFLGILFYFIWIFLTNILNIKFNANLELKFNIKLNINNIIFIVLLFPILIIIYLYIILFNIKKKYEIKIIDLNYNYYGFYTVLKNPVGNYLLLIRLKKDEDKK